MAIIDNRGRQIPFFITSFTYEYIASVNFDPITNATDTYGTALNTSQVGKYSRNGFLVRPNTDGLLYGITFDQYERNKKSLTGLTPQGFLGLANTWIECPFVKVYSNADGSYASTSTYCNIAPIE
jgi:hypothetical protein